MQIAVHTLISALVTDILISHRPLLDRLFDIVENLNFQEDEDILVKSDCFHQIITALLDKDNNDPDALSKVFLSSSPPSFFLKSCIFVSYHPLHHLLYIFFSSLRLGIIKN